MAARFALECPSLYLGLCVHQYVLNPAVNHFRDNIKMFCRFIDDVSLLSCGRNYD